MGCKVGVRGESEAEAGDWLRRPLRGRAERKQRRRLNMSLRCNKSKQFSAIAPKHQRKNYCEKKQSVINVLCKKSCVCLSL